MNSQVIQCPSCRTTLRIPAATTFRCPSCSTLIKQSGPPASPARTAQTPPLRASSSAGGSAWTTPAKTTNVSPTFYKRLAAVLGITCTLVVLFGLVGLRWEPLAIAGVGLGCIATIILLFTGRIWIIVSTRSDELTQKLLVTFAPFYSYYYAVTRKGSALKGLWVMLSSFVPLLITMLVMLMLRPVYSGSYRMAAIAERSETRAAQMETLIRESEASISADAVIRTARYRWLGNPERVPDAIAIDQLLGDFQSYVPNSASVERSSRTIAFDYRGPENHAGKLRFYLGSKLRVPLVPAVQAEQD